MKAFKFIGMLFAALALSFTATSCGNDDDVDDIIEGIENGHIKASADLKKSSNELVLTIKIPGAYTEVTTAKFSNKLCTKYVIVTTFASDALADKAWSEYQAEEGDEIVKAVRNGKTITIDLSEEFEGMEYDWVLATLEAEKAAIDRSYN